MKDQDNDSATCFCGKKHYNVLLCDGCWERFVQSPEHKRVHSAKEMIIAIKKGWNRTQSER